MVQFAANASDAVENIIKKKNLLSILICESESKDFIIISLINVDSETSVSYEFLKSSQKVKIFNNILHTERKKLFLSH